MAQRVAFTKGHGTGNDFVMVVDLDHLTSGIAVLDHIKRHNRHCTVIMLTNCAHIEFRQRCLDAGANHFLEKSREFSRVANVLRQLLRQRSGAVE